jgi:hypothetical protein
MRTQSKLTNGSVILQNYYCRMIIINKTDIVVNKINIYVSHIGTFSPRSEHVKLK